ncbi:MAG: hypothetical protein ACOX8Q_05205 [Christensenellales bacterium]
MNDSITAIIAAAAMRATQNGKTDINQLMRDLCGTYQVDGTEVKKIEQCQISSADAGRNDAGVDREKANVEVVQAGKRHI